MGKTKGKEGMGWESESLEREGLKGLFFQT